MGVAGPALEQLANSTGHRQTGDSPRLAPPPADWPRLPGYPARERRADDTGDRTFSAVPIARVEPASVDRPYAEQPEEVVAHSGRRNLVAVRVGQLNRERGRHGEVFEDAIGARHSLNFTNAIG